MQFSKVESILPKIKPKLVQYQYIMRALHSVNTATDLDFQHRYNGFYRVQRRKPEFYAVYYGLLEKYKNQTVSFSDILQEIYNNTGRMEASFSSKMLSVIDPHYPVWDKYVLENLGMKAPYTYDKNRMKKILHIYQGIIDWYDYFLKTDEAISVIEKFDRYYPDSGITSLKKIDFIIWQTR